ncbi:hypothetical protein ABT282_28975 [Streptomyces sp. NPDC000927]|uniref:hypothetical protein n=1 Tax=Streptomyces sp. NPDC000927 TaxID=3154371 RepID=UPI00332CAA60
MTITRQRVAAVIGTAGITAALVTGTAPAQAQPTAQALSADCREAVQSAAARGERTATCTQVTQTTALASIAKAAAAGLTCKSGYLTYETSQRASGDTNRITRH